MKITNKDIADVLDITSRSVQNKRTGKTKWLLSEYQLLVKFYGQEEADKITKDINSEEFNHNDNGGK